MILQKMTNNSLDGSINRISVPQRTGSLKSSAKDKPPFYRPTATRSSVDSFCPYPSASPASNSESTSNTRDHTNIQSAVCQPEPHETRSQQQQSIAEESEQNHVESTRGIPTVEIVGSSLKKPLRSGSKTEPTKKVSKSKLPQLLTKPVKEPKVDHTNQQDEQKMDKNDSSNESNISESVLLQTQPRRNSLERPSYYNALCKNSLQALNSSMTKSLNLSAGQSMNGDLSSDSSASAINEESTRFSKYMPLRFDSRESSVTEKDYLATRPYSSLSRTFSLKNPSVNSYTVLRKSPQKSIAVGELEGRFSSSPVVGINRSSSARSNERYSSRFLRPKSFYEGSDLSKYQSNSSALSSSITDTGKLTSDYYSSQKSMVGRRSPSYQRSISLFEGSKSTDTGRPSRITPDRSVLKKFLPDRKAVNEEENVLSVSEINEKSKARKVSRFLRPDFYDTPKEDSVYEKKEKTKNTPNGDIWEEKNKALKSSNKKSKSSQNDTKNETRVSIIDKAIRSLKEHSSSKTDRESMERESNLIKRAVSLEDCSIVPESRHRRSTSVTPQSSYGNTASTSRNKEPFQKKKHEDFRKIVDQNLSAKAKELALGRVQKEDSVIKKLVRKLSPNGTVKKKVSKDEDNRICNGSIDGLESNHNATDESGMSLQDSHTRLNRIAGLKRLEFGRQVPSADSTPSMEESKISTELDDSSSFLSPTEDGSDTWSISSDYTDAREFNFSLANPEDSVSDRIRRKSFYSRFNQSKRKKSSQSSQLGGSRSRLPTYSRSVSSDFNNLNQSKPI